MKKYMFVTVGLCAISSILFYVMFGGYNHYDIDGHWKICNLALQGENPFIHIGDDVPSGFSTVPWACILGNVFYAGFLPIEYARIYIWIMHWVLFVASLVLYYYVFFKNTKISTFALYILLLLGQFSFLYSLKFGNDGALICLLIVDMICIIRKYQFISGILLGFSLMKPQISLIFFIPLLFNKQYKTIIVSLVIAMFSFALTSLFVNETPFELIKEMLRTGTESSVQYLGLLSFLSCLGVNSKLVLGINVILGICYVFILRQFARNNFFLMFVPACIASTFWIYKNATDCYILFYVSAK